MLCQSHVRPRLSHSQACENRKIIIIKRKHYHWATDFIDWIIYSLSFSSTNEHTRALIKSSNNLYTRLQHQIHPNLVKNS